MVKFFKNTDRLWQLIFLVSLVAMCGSLFFSEVLKYEPCKLCWYQRVIMYPMVIISVMTVINKTYKNAYLILVMSIIGLSTSTYHYLLQHIPSMQQQGSACGLIPCTGIYINWLGFITIPFLAGTAFAIIMGLSIVLIKTNAKRD